MVGRHPRKKVTKTCIEATVLNSLTPLSKAEICKILPDVSHTTVEAVLGAMQRMEMNVRQANRLHEPGKAPLKCTRLGGMGRRTENKFASCAGFLHFFQLRQQKIRNRQHTVRTPGLGRTEYQ